MIQHIIPISGGKDSSAVACLALERFARRPPPSNLPPRFMHCDVGLNEHQITIDHIGYLDEWLRREIGCGIDIIKADFSAEFAERRKNLQTEWRKRKEIRRHSAECKALTDEMGWTEARDHRRACSCPLTIYEPVDEALIAEAMELLHPTGDPFLDLCMLKGRFPGARSRFCTEELKLAPMALVKDQYWQAGISTCEWVGERADESPGRAKKPGLQRIRRPEPGVSQILYRPVHQMSAHDVFAIAERHGLKPNPLYLMGAKRVGCWPCIMCGKDEIINIAERTPEHIERLRRWEALVSKLSRRGSATFFYADPGMDVLGIDAIIEWARTGRGGRQFDMFRIEGMRTADRDGLMCDSAYGLCE